VSRFAPGSHGKYRPAGVRAGLSHALRTTQGMAPHAQRLRAPSLSVEPRASRRRRSRSQLEGGAPPVPGATASRRRCHPVNPAYLARLVAQQGHLCRRTCAPSGRWVTRGTFRLRPRTPRRRAGEFRAQGKARHPQDLCVGPRRGRTFQRVNEVLDIKKEQILDLAKIRRTWRRSANSTCSAASTWPDVDYELRGMIARVRWTCTSACTRTARWKCAG